MNNKEAERLRDQALKLHESGEYSKAERMLLDALYLLDSKEHPLYQTIVYGLGINYVMQGNYEGATLCFEEGRMNAESANNMENELEMLHQLILHTHNLGHYEASARLCREEILYREKYRPESYEDLAAAYLEGSRNFLIIREKAVSDQMLRQAMEYAKKTQDDHCIAGVTMGMGDVYLHLGKWKEADEAYRESAILYQKEGNRQALEKVRQRLKQVQNLRKETEES